MTDQIQEIIDKLRDKGKAEKDLEGTLDFFIAEEGGNFFAFPVTYVNEAIELDARTSIVHIPLTDPYILGVINVKGEMLPVLSLGKILGHKDSRQNFVVIIEESCRVCFAFEKLVEIVSVPTSGIHPLIRFAENSNSAFLKDEFEYDNSIVRIVDVLALFQSSWIL